MATNAIKRIVLKLDSTGFEKSIDKSKRQVKGLDNSFKAAAIAAGALFATKQIVSFASEAAKLAGTMDGVQKAFDRFGDVQLFAGLDQAVNGTLSKLEIMQQSVKAVNLGVRKNDLATYFEFATRRAAETGEEVSYLVDSIVNGIGRESSRVIDNLGISQERLNAEIQKTGDFQTAVAKIVDEELGAMGPRIETTAEKFAQLAANTQNAYTEFGRLVEPAVVAGLDRINQSLSRITISMGLINQAATNKEKLGGWMATMAEILDWVHVGDLTGGWIERINAMNEANCGH